MGQPKIRYGPTQDREPVSFSFSLTYFLHLSLFLVQSPKRKRANDPSPLTKVSLSPPSPSLCLLWQEVLSRNPLMNQSRKATLTKFGEWSKFQQETSQSKITLYCMYRHSLSISTERIVVQSTESETTRQGSTNHPRSAPLISATLLFLRLSKCTVTNKPWFYVTPLAVNINFNDMFLDALYIFCYAAFKNVSKL